MTLLARGDLLRLAAWRAEPSISIYARMERAGVQTRQNAVRFENLLRQAERELQERGFKPRAYEEWIAPARALLQDTMFWQHQSDGLAVFVAPGLFELYELPVACEDLVVVAGELHLKPLIPLLVEDGVFYVLALSRNHVRLLRGTRDRIEPVRLREVPTSLREALWMDDPERQLQFHTGTQTYGHGGRRGAIFHGHGVGTDDDKARLERYCRVLDRGLHEVLREESAPLVLAAVDYLHPIFRKACSYKHLLPVGITGNPDHLTDAELHQQAWKLVAPRFREQQQAALERMREGQGTGLVVHELREVLQAAYEGRVDTLLVAAERDVWGQCRYAGGQLELETHAERQPGDEDLLDVAAQETLLRRGRVFVVPEAELGGRHPVAAILRY
ncbi:MAG: hypothetical protein KatS3mg102_2002 [Planctomycetota bacterium]|nr:MAG: hypothetical protein KatS3mg102_2002 [Planctomycetota bacterium]